MAHEAVIRGRESFGPGTQPGTDHLVDQHGAHPGPRVYVTVAAILAIITGIEVGVYYIQWLHDEGLIVPILLVLSAFKFAAVVGYFMHLKFDDRRFTGIFLGGLVVGGSIVLTLIALFHFHKVLIDVARHWIAR